MASTVGKIIHISKQGFDAVCRGAARDKYTAKAKRGFIVHHCDASRLQGRYIYATVVRDRVLNPETLETETVERAVNVMATFDLSFTHGWLRAKKPGDIVALKQAFVDFDGMFKDEPVKFEFEDFRVDVVEVFRALRSAHTKTNLQALRIKDYLGREHILTTANFKLMEHGHESDLLKKHAGQIAAFTAACMTADGRQTVTVASNGRVQHSDGLPSDLLELLHLLVVEHHEQTEVETVEV